MDLGIEQGFECVYNLRLQRWVRATMWRISPREPMRAQTRAESVLHEPLLALQIAKCLIWCTDGFEAWIEADEVICRSGPNGVEWDDTDRLPR